MGHVLQTTCNLLPRGRGKEARELFALFMCAVRQNARLLTNRKREDRAGTPNNCDEAPTCRKLRKTGETDLVWHSARKGSDQRDVTLSTTGATSTSTACVCACHPTICSYSLRRNKSRIRKSGNALQKKIENLASKLA